MAANPSNLPSAHILSPCVSICVLDGVTGYCLGCLRSRDEIQGWPRLSPNQKQHLLEELQQRRERNAAPLAGEGD